MDQMVDIHGKALFDYFNHCDKGNLFLNTSYGAPEEMPFEVFFRNAEELSPLEEYAVSLCSGRILDAGAGVGSIALILQERGLDVVGLELSSALANIMKQRGLRQVVNEDIFNYKGSGFDTILFLMNGIGLVGKLNRLPRFLEFMKHMLRPEGQLLFDSSNINYLYHDLPKPKDGYYGEIQYQYEYKSEKGDWFDWLYIDQGTLYTIAQDNGWNSQVIFEDEHDQYLARLTQVK